MTEVVQFLLILLGVTTVAFLGSYLKTKLSIGEKEEQTFKSILETIRFIVSEFNIEQRDDVILAIEATYKALDLIDKVYTEEDLNKKKELIMGKTLKTCQSLGVDIEGDNYLVVEVVDRVTDYIIGEEFVKEIKNN